MEITDAVQMNLASFRQFLSHDVRKRIKMCIRDRDVPGSLGWDSSVPRIATWAIFKHIASGKKFFFVNTCLLYTS